MQSRAWAVTSQRRHALIAAPTGSGKTLAAFLSAINELVVEGLHGLTDEVHVLYVSPLKALSNDIRKNLQEPLAGIREAVAHGPARHPRRGAHRRHAGGGARAHAAHAAAHPGDDAGVAVHPAQLGLGRAMLKSVKSVIVDELHAVAGTKRGAHLMLSLERLEALCEAAGAHRPVRHREAAGRDGAVPGRRPRGRQSRSSTPAIFASAISRSRCRARR